MWVCVKVLVCDKKLIFGNPLGKKSPIKMAVFSIECFYNHHKQFKAIYDGFTDVEMKKKFNNNMKACPIYKSWRSKMEKELTAYLEEEAQKPENIARRKKEEADIKNRKGHW